MNSLKMMTAAFLFGTQVSPSAIERTFHQKNITPSKALEYTNPANLKLASVQLEPREYNSLGQYIDHMEEMVRQAADGGAQMVCFPEYTGLLPLMISPTLRETAKSAVSALFTAQPFDQEHFIQVFRDYLSGPLFNCYYNTFSLLADHYQLYIQAGSTLIYTHGELRERGFLFSPDGETVLEQDKLSLSPMDCTLGITPGTELEIASTPLGKIAVLVGEDSSRFEPSKLAHALGAQVLICPAAPTLSENIAPYLCGAFMRCQEFPAFAVVSCLVGQVGGCHFYGRSGLFGPYEAARLPSGVCSQAENHTRTTVTVGRINLERLHSAFNLYTSDTNPAIYAKLEKAYRNLSDFDNAPQEP